MIVVLREDEGVRLEDNENFRELTVDAVGLTPEAVDAAGAGELDGDHLWIDVELLRSRGIGTEEWCAGFAAMIAYAATRGWTDAGGSRVRAHIRWR